MMCEKKWGWIRVNGHGGARSATVQRMRTRSEQHWFGISIYPTFITTALMPMPLALVIRARIQSESMMMAHHKPERRHFYRSPFGVAIYKDEKARCHSVQLLPVPLYYLPPPAVALAYLTLGGLPKSRLEF